MDNIHFDLRALDVIEKKVYLYVKGSRTMVATRK